MFTIGMDYGAELGARAGRALRGRRRILAAPLSATLPATRACCSTEATTFARGRRPPAFAGTCDSPSAHAAP